MTDPEFKDLVNLFLDGELTERQRADLRAELRRDLKRRREFESRCRLHKAMQLALKPEVEFSKGQTRPARRFRRGAVLGMVACFALGAVLLLPAIQDSVELPAPAGGEVAAGAVAVDGRTERPAASFVPGSLSGRPEQAARKASLAAHLRLAGLHPELAREAGALQTIDPASLAGAEGGHLKGSERLEALKRLETIPKVELIRAEAAEAAEIPSRPSSGWPSGFEASLANVR